MSLLAPTGAVQNVRIFNIQQTNIVLGVSPPIDTLQNGLLTSYTIFINDTAANTTMIYVLNLNMPIHPLTQSFNITGFMLIPLTNYSVYESVNRSVG